VSRLLLVATLTASLLSPQAVAAQNAPTTASEGISANENREGAGALEGGVLTVRLEARAGTWHPEGPGGMELPVAAFAEEGKPLQNPGPLLRMPAGTEARVTVRNSLDKPLTVFGLGPQRGLAADSLVIPPGEVREARFRATEPGTYYYAGKTIPAPVFARLEEDSQLNGAIVVDPAGAAVHPNDRPFVISWWGTLDSTSVSGLGRFTMVINGLSWPHTERFHVTQGDSLYWRWINLTGTGHPMHLHGFYFRVDARGDGALDTLYGAGQRRLAVTELINPGETAATAWSPTRPGNWIFHCHFAGHLSHLVALDTDRGIRASTHETHDSDAPHQMSGLVLGIHVEPSGSAPRPVPEGQPMRLVIRSKPGVYGDHPGYSFALGGTPEEADPDAMTVPGPALMLERDEPVAITMVNRSHEPAAVHWHGIELESYPDGVPGWSGEGANILPSIPPGDSLTVRFTPPRAGTFMYHSHFNEFQQIGSGMYGPILVLEPGQAYDPETDRVLLFSDGGPIVNVIAGPFPPVLLNGQVAPLPMELRAGVTYRFRVINIKTDFPEKLALLDGDEPVEWRLVAKDGADLPASQATMRPADLTFAPGEIFDFEFTPRSVGDLALRFGFEEQQEEPTVVVVRVR